MSINHHPWRQLRMWLVAGACAGLLSACSGSNSLELGGNERARSTDNAANQDDAQSVRLRQVKRLPAPPNTSEGSDQLIAESDVLDIDVYEVDQLDREAQVDSRGQISVPLLGTIKVAGLTARQLETKLERSYGSNYLQKPNVTVSVKDSIASRVTIDGEVRRAGSIKVGSKTTLLQVVANAGGFSEIADPSKVYVYRQIGSERLVANYDVMAIRAARQSDPRIYGGDFVMIFSSDTKIAAKNLREALGLATGVAQSATLPGL